MSAAEMPTNEMAPPSSDAPGEADARNRDSLQDNSHAVGASTEAGRPDTEVVSDEATDPEGVPEQS